MEKTCEWYLGDMCGSITGFIFILCWRIPDIFNYANCFEGFNDGFDDEVDNRP